ncbi:MAG: hypothetical protein JRI68_04950 [Deltaproteobacteria bacterium]|nr:hypothetical protein [Deltaproteobacteria bacterium]
MFVPFNIASDDRRKKSESGAAESVWRKRGEPRKGEPVRRRQSPTPSESPESKRGSSLVSGSG